MADYLVEKDKLEANNQLPEQPKPVGPLNNKFLQPVQTKLRKKNSLVSQLKMPPAPEAPLPDIKDQEKEKSI